MRKPVLYANNKDTDQSSASFCGVADQNGLNLTWSQNPEDRFFRDKAHIILPYM